MPYDRSCAHVITLVYKEKQALKFKKWQPQALQGILVKYNKYTIYNVYIWDENKVIHIKNLYIFKDYKFKAEIKFLTYQNTHIFQGF